MIAEYPGPPGPLGFAEYFGWLALCIGVGILSARLADRWRNGAPRHHALLLAAFALPLVFTGFLVWEIQPSTPGRVKDVVEYSLQAIGLLAMGLSLGWIGWRSLRR